MNSSNAENIQLCVKGLQKSFGTQDAVNGISFDVFRGETFGLLGPNGAGKTTTIHILTGILKADKGSIGIAGQHSPSCPQVRTSMGFAPQSLALYAELSAEENLRFFAKLYNLTGMKLNERIDWALEFAGLTERRRSKVSQYSGGMKRRLNLACALIHDPQVIFLDEPMVGVDPQSRNHIIGNIRQLRKNGRTILYTTHYMEEASRLCDRIAIIDSGRILALDTPEGLISEFGGPSRLFIEVDRKPDPETPFPWELSNGVLDIETDNPLADLAEIYATGIRAKEIRVERPNLEKVFLNLTGRKLRDE